VNLRSSVLEVYKLMSENKSDEAEDAAVALLRCPGCEELLQTADGREARIARCGHVYHKEPRDCWAKMCAASEGRNGTLCMACGKPSQ
jgi:hypothetical protein